jgi:hypothetical protein
MTATVDLMTWCPPTVCLTGTILCYILKHRKLIVAHGCSSVVAYPLFPPAFPPARHVTYTTCFSHVDIVHTRLSLPCLKYSSSALALSVCTSLPQWVIPCSTLHVATSFITLLAPYMHIFEHKMKHVERQRVLPAFAHDLSCT